MPFSANFHQARAKFRQLAADLGFDILRYPVPVAGDEGLTIDVAISDSKPKLPTVVISSGLHGVEGFVGSAIQIELLRTWFAARGVPKDIRVVMIHGINPYGFSELRRWNEDGIDLNRNFLLPHEPYDGCSPIYQRLHGFLNPDRPPSRFDGFYLKAMAEICKHGLSELKQAIAEGQYEYEEGLFFGGKSMARSARVIAKRMESWLGESDFIVHLDVHSGLGRWRTYKLLIDYPINHDEANGLAAVFGKRYVELSDPQRVAYTARGGWGNWCFETFRNRQYYYLCAEYGTYSPVVVLNRLRQENQAHRFRGANDPARSSYKRLLKNVFCPQSPAWRQNCLLTGHGCFRQALELTQDSRVRHLRV